jgi:hypothetical protein
MVELVPVDHDPFAGAASAGPALVPVDHDPFAQPQYNVTPGDANNPTRITPARPLNGMERMAAGMPADRKPGNVNVGVQGAARAVADTLGLLPDLANMGTNLILAGADKASRTVGGPEIGYRFPMASDELSGNAERVASAFGVRTTDPDSMSTPERLAYNVNRFGTQAALTAGVAAPVAVSRATAAGARTPKAFDPLLRAYETAPVKAAAGDVVANATGGAALTASQSMSDQTRSGLGGTVGPVADLIAMLAGQTVGGAALHAAATPGYVAHAVRDRMAARDIPYDPKTGLATTNKQADAAARYVQANSADPVQAARNIEAGAAEFRGMDAPVPTSGAMSRDPKLMAVERGTRLGSPGDFAMKDVALRDSALDAIEGVRPQNVDPRVATDFLRGRYDDRTNVVESAVRTARGRLEQVDQSQRATADAVRPYAGGMAPASESIDRLIIDKSLRPMDAKRRADFDAIPREATVPGEPFVDAAKSVRASADHLPENAKTEVLPTKRLEDFESLLIRDEAGNISGIKPASFGLINDLRPILGAETARARAEGAPPSYIDNLERLRKELNKATNSLPEAKAAVENFNRDYAPIWGRPAGTAYDFRQDFNVDRSSRTASPPTATAGRFLTTGAGAKEKAAALARIVDSLPADGDKAAVTSSIRQYVMGDLSKTIGADGKIAEISLARWLNGPSGWGDALSQFPTVRTEIAGMLRDVQNGAAQRNAMATELQRANANVVRTQRELGHSALSLTLGKEPVKAARAVLDGGDPKMAMREIVKEIGENASARRAWERAVTEHLIDRVSSVNPGAVSEGSTALDFAKLTKAMKQYEGALGEMYVGQSDKMNALRRAQKMLEPLAVRAGAAADGGPVVGASDRAWKCSRRASRPTTAC